MLPTRSRARQPQVFFGRDNRRQLFDPFARVRSHNSAICARNALIN
jgi:hypothetical protein